MKRKIYGFLTILCTLWYVILTISFSIKHWFQPKFIVIFNNFGDILAITFLAILAAIFMMLYEKEGKKK